MGGTSSSEDGTSGLASTYDPSTVAWLPVRGSHRRFAIFIERKQLAYSITGVSRYTKPWYNKPPPESRLVDREPNLSKTIVLSVIFAFHATIRATVSAPEERLFRACVVHLNAR